MVIVTNKIINSSNKINNLYKNLNYYDMYGGSIFIFTILVIILMLVFAYSYVMKNIQPIKDNWVQERCNPKVIPFAGYINKPDGSTAFEYTKENYDFCVQNILKSISGYAVEPITFVTNAISEMYNTLMNSLNNMRAMFSNIRTSVGNIAQEIFGRIMNVIIPIQYILVSVSDLMQKAGGVMTATLYTVMGVIDMLKSMMGAILEALILILVLMAALIISMFIGLAFPPAMAALAIFIVIAGICATLIIFLTTVMDVHVKSSIPPTPSPSACFDKHTKIEMVDGTYKSISKIKVGDILIDKSRVTSVLKLDVNDEIMYNLNGIIVSGSHYVLYNKIWVAVALHPDSKPFYKYKEPIIYCLNTTSKIITIRGMNFMDWDELDTTEITELLNKMNTDKIGNNTVEDINNYYDNGFIENIKLKLLNGTVKNIQDVNIGDILEQKCKVIGLVELDGINLRKKHLGYLDNIDINNENENSVPLIQNTEKLYHLVTDKQYFIFNNKKYPHYNSCIEQHLNKHKGFFYL